MDSEKEGGGGGGEEKRNINLHPKHSNFQEKDANEKTALIVKSINLIGTP